MFVALHQLFFLVVYVIVVLWSDGLLQDFRKTFAFCVCMVPEIEEEEEEDDAVQSNDVHEQRKGVWTVFHEEVLADVNGYEDKLDLKEERVQIESNGTLLVCLVDKNRKTLEEQVQITSICGLESN